MIDLLELVARTFALLGSGSGGSVVIPALIVVGLIGAATAAVVLVAAILGARGMSRSSLGPESLHEVENLRVLVTYGNPNAPGHARPRAPGRTIVTVRTAGVRVL
jgi:hypothetical protein